METVDEFKMNETQILKIYNDYDVESPRTADHDNMCQMICFHKRYLLGDEHDIDPDDYNSYDDMMEVTTVKGDIVVPLYLYDHGNISISTGAFSCRWDSGQVGYATVTLEKIIETYGDNSQNSRNNAKKCLEAEVETYNNYLTGATYGFQVVETETCNLGHKHELIIDSCWGFYGYDHEESGLFDHAGYVKSEVA